MTNLKLKTMTNIKTRLQDGEHIEFESENDMMTISFGSGFGSQKFWWIQLNCKFIHSSKTFKSFDNKLSALINERNLTEC